MLVADGQICISTLMIPVCGRSVALAALIGLLFFAGSSFAAPPATTLYGIMGDGVSPNYTFATVNTTTGIATPIFSFTLSYPVTALAYDQNTGKFVALGQVGSTPPYTGMIVQINASTQTLEEHAINGLPLSSFTNFAGEEFTPAQYTQIASDHVLVTYGQDSNHNLQNRIAAIDPSTGAVLAVTAPALVVSDFDIAVFNPVTSTLIDADTNDAPFEAISNVFGAPPTIVTYASPNNDGELYDAAMSANCPGCLSSGTMFFSRRATRDLWKLRPDGSGYQLVGAHSLSNQWAVGGLAFAPEPGAPPIPAVPALSPGVLVLLTVLLMAAGWVMLRRKPRTGRASPLG
jgi:hypothetical protein